VQWKNYPASGTTTTLGARFNFQVKIYETTNAVEFIYGSKNITVNSASSYPSVSASVGIRDSSAGFREGKTGSSSTGVSNYRVGDFPPSGVIYRFDTSSSGTTSTLTDMLFPNQWHLYNYGQFGGTPGEDLNVLNVWNSNKGDGTCIVAVDDGMDINHPDISPNVLSGASVNYAISSSKGPNDPSGSGANHGTCVSGLFGARDSNAIGVRGVAPRASIFSYNVLQNGTSANIGDAMSRGAFHVSNNSWGAPDGTGLLIADFADSSWVEGLRQGTSGQRNGKGAVYTWAAGNGSGLCSSSYVIDNSNYDAQANYYQVVAVAASGDNGKQACYSEKGANLWITAPSQGQIYGSSAVTAVTTTDNSSTYGYNTSTASNSVNYSDYVDLGYTDTFNGTSSTAPMIAGVASLILKANPNLTWRDVKLILAETARKNDPTDSDWDTTGNKVALSGKYNFNHKYGFGVADANAATTLASNWTSVGGSSSLIQCDSPISSPNAYIPDNNSSGISNTINFTNCSIKSIEFVEIYISIYHTYYGDLQISLNSPLGKTSILSEAHTCYDEDGNLAGCGDFPSPWRFGSAKHLGESSTGNWTISVKDLVNGDTGQLQFWWVRIRGR
jgi:kexin